MKDLLMLFGVTLAKRYTNRQKKVFFSQVEPFFTNLGYTVTVQENKKKWLRVFNMLIGDICKAQYIVLCPYDTPSKSLLPYTYYPYNLSKNLRQENQELFLRSLVYMTSCLVAYFMFKQYANLNTFLKIASIIFFVSLIVFCYWLIVGIPNSINFNRNSASVALVASLASHTRGNGNVAYVLLDDTVSSNVGWRIFADDKNLKNKTIVYIDCVSCGEKLVCAHSQAADHEAKKMVQCLSKLDLMDHVFTDKQLKDTNLQYFPVMLHLCSGTIEDHYFVVRNTRSRKDFKVDVSRLETLCEGLQKYLGE